MSLRARILLFILAVNLGVTALLGIYLQHDLERRDADNRAADEAQQKDYVTTFQRFFDGYLSVETPGEEKTVAEAVRALVQHPLRKLVKDGVVLQTRIASEQRRAMVGENAVLPANAVYMNLPGAKHRAPTFDDQRARL